MAATHNTGAVARPATDWLKILDARAADLGAETEAAKATLLRVNITTLWRWRKGDVKPSRDKALEIAQLLGIPMEEVVAR